MTQPQPLNLCQHCQRLVRWGRTEQGFNSFVHEATGLAACPEAEEAEAADR